MTMLHDLKDQLRSLDSTKIFFSDLNGRLMSLRINSDDLDSILERGVGFDGSSIAGYATVENSDRLLIPDENNCWIVNFGDESEKLGFLVGKIHNEKGERAKADPRAVLENVLENAKEEFGYQFLAGPEHEFFLLKGDEFDRKEHSDKAGYFYATPHDKGEYVRKEIVDILTRCGVRFEKAHHEVTPSQHEINLECTDPLKAADRTLLFSYITQKIAVDRGYYATFMPKPFDNYNRNAFHIHLSMQNDQGENIFYDEKAENNISTLAKQFIGGVLKYARETSVIMASIFNSYKAYVAEREAPIIRGWGFRNRSSMVRVPYAIHPDKTRIELRNPDPAGNVYLQFAVFIAMGLQGIREGLDCTKPDSKSSYDHQYKEKVWDKRFLPKSLYEALVEAERSDFLKNVLGERIYEKYITLKMQDWEEHRVHITSKEVEMYLNI